MKEAIFYVEIEPEWSAGLSLLGIKAVKLRQRRPVETRGPVVKIKLRMPDAAFNPIAAVTVDVPDSAVDYSSVVRVDVEPAEPASEGAEHGDQ